MTLHDLIDRIAATELPRGVMTAEVSEFSGRNIHVTERLFVETFDGYSVADHLPQHGDYEKIYVTVSGVEVMALRKREHKGDTK